MTRALSAGSQRGLTGLSSSRWVMACLRAWVGGRVDEWMAMGRYACMHIIFSVHDLHKCVINNRTHFSNKKQDGARCLAYTSVPELRMSDHRPVACTLELAVRGHEEAGGQGDVEDEEEEGEGEGEEVVGGFQFHWFGTGVGGGGGRGKGRRVAGSSSTPRIVEVCVVS
jgi:hypothetical protein